MWPLNIRPLANNPLTNSTEVGKLVTICQRQLIGVAFAIFGGQPFCTACQAVALRHASVAKMHTHVTSSLCINRKQFNGGHAQKWIIPC